MMGLTVDKAGAARALALAGARHWPAHLGERPAVEPVADPELRSALSAWAMATLALTGFGGAVNVDRAQVAALGASGAKTTTLLGMFERAWEAPAMRLAEGVSLTFRDSSDPSAPRTFEMRADVAGVASGAAETARVGEDSGSGRSGPIGGNARDRERVQPVMSPESRPVLPELLAWLDVEVRAGRLAPERRAELGVALESRTAVGVARYRVPLHSHNGLPGRKQTREELLDGLQYETQDLMETDDLDAQVWVAIGRTKTLEAWCALQQAGDR